MGRWAGPISDQRLLTSPAHKGRGAEARIVQAALQRMNTMTTAWLSQCRLRQIHVPAGPPAHTFMTEFQNITLP
jgi:hypothetical protein